MSNDQRILFTEPPYYPAPDARTLDEQDADDAVYEEAVREIALGLPGRPGVIR